MADKKFRDINVERVTKDRNRDVHGGQNFERGEMKQTTDFTLRAVIGGMATVGIILGLMAFICGVQIGLWTVFGYPFDGKYNLYVIFFGGPWLFWRYMIMLLVGLPIIGLLWMKMWRSYKVMNLVNDHSDINTYEGDQHIALFGELIRDHDYEWFPDVGAIASPQVNALVSHVALSNKGIKPIRQTQFYSKDDPEVKSGEKYAGDMKTDDDGYIVQKKVPFIDEKFAEALYDSASIKDKKYRDLKDASKLPYDPNNERRSGVGKFKTVADAINGDWELPYYEPQRPGGAYLVDTAPVNSLVVAMTRAGFVLAPFIR